MERDTDTDTTLREDMEASARALAAADDAPLREAMEGVRWERSGLLQRLTRE